jgi:DNA integrity scanning protein DisA with diadenylate cyclase activity
MPDRSDSPEALAWLELKHRGSVRQRYLKNLEREIAAELAHCFDPVIFEHAIRPYGAIVARETPPLNRLGRVLNVAHLEADALRSLADGQASFVLIAKGQPPQLVLMNERLQTDQDYASRAVWIDGLFVSNDKFGVVRIITDSSVTLVEGRRWITNDLVFEAAEDIVELVPASDADVVRRLLELAHHRISPRRIGATLLYLLTDVPTETTRRERGIELAALNVSVMNEIEELLVLHQVQYRDGAVLIGHDGRLLAANVMLRPSVASEGVVAATGGTRHTSAARHTYDCPDVLAVVVSASGPVTVFSDGRRIAELKGATPPAAPKTPARIAALTAERRAERAKDMDSATFKRFGRSQP